MSDHERNDTGLSEYGPPDEVMIDAEHLLHFASLGSHRIDIRHLPRPIDTMNDIPEPLSDDQRAARDAYMEMCATAYGAIWHETEMFVATTAIDRDIELDESAIFDTHLAFDELIQNAFRHGDRPQQISISIVNATHAFSFTPKQPNGNTVQLSSPQNLSASGNRILLGVQDASSEWQEPEQEMNDVLPEHLRGLDIVRGISRSVWHQSNEESSKWVWALI